MTYNKKRINMSNISSNSLYEQIVEQVKNINTEGLSDDVSNSPSTSVIEEQKIYFWTRLYLREENPNVEPGDDVNIVYTPSGEELKTKFICYGKQGLERDHDGEVTSYNTEDDKKILCLMIDSKQVNYSEDIPFIRTLFKAGFHYDYQLIKRDDLIFTLDKSRMILDYYDVDF